MRRDPQTLDSDTPIPSDSVRDTPTSSQQRLTGGTRGGDGRPALCFDAAGMPFDCFDLPDVVRAGIRDAGFTHCTPIQEKVLPLSLGGRDIAGQAQTGTGKTAAFLITLFTRLVTTRPVARPASPRALIVAPTRELVVQIADDAQLLGSHTGLATHAVYGGIDYRKQRDALQRHIDVLIGTPGRLIDYYKQQAYSLRRTALLVIDEADRMFDMGFIRDLRFLLRRLPSYSHRQSMLFSATLSYAVLELAYEHMNDPAHVSASHDNITADKIEHLIYHLGAHEKPCVLVRLLQQEASERVLVFTNMRRTAQSIVNVLAANGVDAAPITGDLEQRQRLRILERFKQGTLPVLVATDVASRGLHIEGVTHVINYDLPQDAQDYVHRTGRTARAGAAGTALSLVCEYDAESLGPIEELIGFKLPFAVPDDHLLAPVAKAERPRRHGVRRRPERQLSAAHGRPRRRRNESAGSSLPRPQDIGSPARRSRRRRRHRTIKTSPPS